MSNYYAADVLQFLTDNWATLLAGWFIASLCLTPLIALFCATNTKDEERSAKGYEDLRRVRTIREPEFDFAKPQCGPEVQEAIDRVNELLRERRRRH